MVHSSPWKPEADRFLGSIKTVAGFPFGVGPTRKSFQFVSGANGQTPELTPLKGIYGIKIV